MKTILKTFLTFITLQACSVFAWNGESSFANMSRAEIQALADNMIDSTWTPHSTFNNFEFIGSDGNPVYSPNYVAGTLYHGVAYGQSYPQNNWNEFYSNISVTSTGKHSYGNDCSGFVSMCWKLPARNTTSTFQNGIGTYWTSLGPTGSVQSVSLLLGDALNSTFDGHMVLFLSYGSAGINTMEQTMSANHCAQRLLRSYSYLVNQKYQPLRRNQITGVAAKAQLTSPVNGSTFNSSAQTFSWNAGSGVTDYFLYLGNSFGAYDIYGYDQGLATMRTVYGIPTDGRTIYVRLWSCLNGVWQFNDYTFRAATANATLSKAQILTPLPGSTFNSSAQTFSWNAGSGVTDYFLYLGTSAGANNIYAADQGMAKSRIVYGIPTDGRIIYVRLWSYLNGGWQFNDYTYRAASH